MCLADLLPHSKQCRVEEMEGLHHLFWDTILTMHVEEETMESSPPKVLLYHRSMEKEGYLHQDGNKPCDQV